MRELRDTRELLSRREPLLFNCTGLGSILPQPEIEYMFPRHDGVLFRGSRERGVWDTQADLGTRDRILRENAAVFNAVRIPGRL